MITIEDLHWDEIKENICGHCGACVPFCDWEKCKGNIEEEKFGTCNICYLFCPRTSSSAINYKTGADASFSIKAYNSVKSIEASGSAQDGAFITTLLKFLLREKIIDSAILTKKNEEWKPVPFIATTEKDIEDASGSKYGISPSLSLLKEAVDKYEKIAFVGLPCQIRALRNVQLQKKHKLNAEKIILAIGLFCRENFLFEGLKGFVEREGVQMTGVKKFDISAGKFRIYSDSEIIEKPVRNLDEHVWPVCHACVDFTSDFSDISAGSVGSKKGNTTVLIRSELGNKLFGKMMEKNLILVENEVDISQIEKLANDKMKNIENLSDDVKKILLC